MKPLSSITLSSVAFVLLSTVAFVAGAQEQTRFGVDASEWSSATVAVPGVIFPVGGAGQVNGNFVTGARNGVEIAIRAQDRFDGLLNVSRDKNAGVYDADAGSEGGFATWNYDIHVDLRSAQGVAAGKTLGDYTLVLDSDIGASVFGCAFPCDLTSFPGTGGLLLLQLSWNPVFGGTGFNPAAEDTYYFTLSLTPKTFHGPAITTRMRVIATNP